MTPVRFVSFDCLRQRPLELPHCLVSINGVLGQSFEAHGFQGALEPGGELKVTGINSEFELTPVPFVSALLCAFVSAREAGKGTSLLRFWEISTRNHTRRRTGGACSGERRTLADRGGLLETLTMIRLGSADSETSAASKVMTGGAE